MNNERLVQIFITSIMHEYGLTYPLLQPWNLQVCSRWSFESFIELFIELFFIFLWCSWLSEPDQGETQQAIEHLIQDIIYSGIYGWMREIWQNALLEEVRDFWNDEQRDPNIPVLIEYDDRENYLLNDTVKTIIQRMYQIIGKAIVMTFSTLYLYKGPRSLK